jgi:hypothetical protein
MVRVGGNLLYGNNAVVERVKSGECEQLTVYGSRKRVCVKDMKASEFVTPEVVFSSKIPVGGKNVRLAGDSCATVTLQLRLAKTAQFSVPCIGSRDEQSRVLLASPPPGVSV